MHNEFAKQIEEKQAELVNPRTAELQNRLGDADKLLDGTQTTRELNRNTAVFCRLTEMGVEQARRLEKNSCFARLPVEEMQVVGATAEEVQTPGATADGTAAAEPPLGALIPPT